MASQAPTSPRSYIRVERRITKCVKYTKGAKNATFEFTLETDTKDGEMSANAQKKKKWDEIVEYVNVCTEGEKRGMAKKGA